MSRLMILASFGEKKHRLYCVTEWRGSLVNAFFQLQSLFYREVIILVQHTKLTITHSSLKSFQSQQFCRLSTSFEHKGYRMVFPSKRALIQILRTVRVKATFCAWEQFLIEWDHSIPLIYLLYDLVSIITEKAWKTNFFFLLPKACSIWTFRIKDYTEHDFSTECSYCGTDWVVSFLAGWRGGGERGEGGEGKIAYKTTTFWDHHSLFLRT